MLKGREKLLAEPENNPLLSKPPQGDLVRKGVDELSGLWMLLY